MVKVPCYSSGSTSGNTILNATNGCSELYKVGSKEECLFYKLTIATGELGQSSINLFFNTPEQAEMYLDLQFSPTDKEKWMNKKNTFIQTHTISID